MSRFTGKFAILQGFYWITSCLVFAYAERFLTAYGFSVQHVGFVMAAANGIALLMQPLFADLADRPKGPSLRSEICFGSAVAILFALLLLLPYDRRPVIAVLFCALSTVTLTVMPMLNSVGLYYVDRGEPIDYSLARGIASLVFAVYSYLAGFLAEWRIDSLLWTYIAANLGMIGMAILFAPKKDHIRKTTVQATGTVTLLKKHPYLLPLFAGIVLTFSTHNFINAYMLSIVKMVGKGTHEMSIAVSLAAVLEIPTMAGFSFLMKRFRLEKLLVVSFAAFAVKHAAMLLPLWFGAGIWSVYASQVIQIFGYALFIPCASFYLNGRMEETDKVKGQMLLTEAQMIGGIIGQLVGGYSIAWIGVPRTMLIGCGLSILALAAVVRAVRAEKRTA